MKHSLEQSRAYLPSWIHKSLKHIFKIVAEEDVGAFGTMMANFVDTVTESGDVSFKSSWYYVRIGAFAAVNLLIGGALFLMFKAAGVFGGKDDDQIIEAKAVFERVKMNSSRIPWHVYLVLLIALIGVSSAGTLLQQIDMIPPILRGELEATATSLLLLPLAIYQYAQMEDKVEVKNQLGLMLLSGVFLALHFSTWIASLDYTSLTHSLLFVTTHPLVILVGMAILSRFKEMKPASTTEWIGGIIGVTGAIITLQDGGTIQGDHGSYCIW